MNLHMWWGKLKNTHRHDRLIAEKKTMAVMSMYFDPPCSLLSVVPRVSPLGTRCYWMGKSQPNDTYSLSWLELFVQQWWLVGILKLTTYIYDCYLKISMICKLGWTLSQLNLSRTAMFATPFWESKVRMPKLTHLTTLSVKWIQTSRRDISWLLKMPRKWLSNSSRDLASLNKLRKTSRRKLTMISSLSVAEHPIWLNLQKIVRVPSIFISHTPMRVVMVTTHSQKWITTRRKSRCSIQWVRVSQISGMNFVQSTEIPTH